MVAFRGVRVPSGRGDGFGGGAEPGDYVYPITTYIIGIANLMVAGWQRGTKKQK
jgi:hypothetical protein